MIANKKTRGSVKYLDRHKIILFTLLAILTGIVSFVLISSEITKSENPPNASCTSNSGMLVAIPLSEVQARASTIAIGNLVGTNKNGTYRFYIEKSIKGTYMKKKTFINVCLNSSLKPNKYSYTPALLLLRGYDEERQLWIPVQDYMGILPSKNGEFISWGDNKSIPFDKGDRLN